MKIKHILLSALIFGISLPAYGVMARPGVRQMRQPDGSSISLILQGDERAHVLTTLDGLPVKRMADGTFRYILADCTLSDVTAHNPEERTASEREFIQASASHLSTPALLRRRSALKASRVNSGTFTATPKATGSSRETPCMGSPRVAILLAQYSDYKFRDADPCATFEEVLNGPGKSVLRYFSDQSNGLYTPQFDIYGPVTLGKRATYGANDSQGYDVGLGQMVAETCLGLDSSVNFALYDNTGNNEADVVIVIYAGDSEADSYEDDAENAIWPCQYYLRYSDYGKKLTLDGTTVNKFAVINELDGTDITRIAGIGTFVHEFSHCIGLADYYDTDYNGFFGMGPWSLMDSGCYLDDGYTPPGYSAFDKEQMDWLSIPEAEEDTYYTLPVFNAGSAETDRAVRLTNEADADEYYILENRSRQGWDEYLPADGLFIYHVTYDENQWYYNTVNNYALQRMTPIPADNELLMDKQSIWGQTYWVVNEESLKGDLWPFGDATELTDESLPAALVNTGKFMGKPITRIERNNDGTVSFWAMRAPLPKLATPSAVSAAISETGDAVHVSWAHDPGTVSPVTFTVEARKEGSACTLIDEYDTEALSLWDITNSVILSDGVLKLGSSNRGGIITSPRFRTTGADGIVTVTFTAYNYINDTPNVSLKLLDVAGDVIASQSTTLTKDPATYTIKLQGDPSLQMVLSIGVSSKKQRFYITDLSIYDGDLTDYLAGAATAITKEGVTGHECTLTGLTPGLTYLCRVRANVPATAADEYSDSEWSEAVTASASGLQDAAADPALQAPAEYFDVLGRRLSAPVPGQVVIERRGATATKRL